MAAHVVRNGSDQAGRDGRMLSERPLYFRRIQRVPSTQYDVLYAVDEIQIAPFILAYEIPGAEPAVRSKHNLGLPWGVPVPVHYVRSAHQQLSDLALRDWLVASVGCADASLSEREWNADRSETARAIVRMSCAEACDLGHAPKLDQSAAKASFNFPHFGDRHALTADCAHPEASKIESLQVRKNKEG